MSFVLLPEWISQRGGPLPLAHTSTYNYPVYKVLFWKAKRGTTGNCILHNGGGLWAACGEEGNFHTRLIRGATRWRFWRAQWWYIWNSFTFGWGSCVLFSAPFRCISVFSLAPCECLAERHEITLPFKPILETDENSTFKHSQVGEGIPSWCLNFIETHLWEALSHSAPTNSRLTKSHFLLCLHKTDALFSFFFYCLHTAPQPVLSLK